MNYFDNPDYVVAIVGAGRGIGKAAALHVAGHGVRVAKPLAARAHRSLP